MRETSASEPLPKHRKNVRRHQNRSIPWFREQHGGNLLTGYAVSGVAHCPRRRLEQEHSDGHRQAELRLSDKPADVLGGTFPAPKRLITLFGFIQLEARVPSKN